MYLVIRLEFPWQNMLHICIYTCFKGQPYKIGLKRRPKILHPKIAFSAVISPGHTGMILSTINRDCNSHGELLLIADMYVWDSR